MTAYASAQTAVKAMKEGAYDYLTKPFEMAELLIMIERIGQRNRLELENTQLKEEIAVEEVNLLGKSAPMREVLDLIEKVAGQNATVLIQGESGTGKELAARAIHNSSPRHQAPMIVVNCAAIPENLLESELFGHERGAFTGADRRRLGRFELADSGTIFLDEVAELAPRAQVKLLRVLQEKSLERLGGSDTIAVDVRVIAATNRDLDQLVADGPFREDLYYRLNVFPILMPPLRDRKEDILLLARHFTARQRKGNTLTPEAEKILINYGWPGNVRELENVLERAGILAGSRNPILPVHLTGISARTGEGVPVPDGGGGSAGWPGQIQFPDEGINLEELEKQHILTALEKAGGNKSEAARLLHISRRRLYSRMAHHEIEY
jgi:two-component system NtrC family response regulator